MKRIFLVLLISSAAMAAPANKKKKSEALPLPEQTREFVFPVPASELDLKPLAEIHSNHRASSLEIQTSTWSPKHFSRPSYFGESELKRNSSNWISLGLTTPWKLNDREAGLFSRIGAGTVRLERRRTADRSTGAQANMDQTISLYFLRLGLEYQTQTMAFENTKAYLGAALLPTMAVAPKTELEQRVSETGTPLEATAGILIEPQKLRNVLGTKRWGFILGAQTVQGTVGGSSMADFGFETALRVEM